jgi:rubredoxin
MAHDGDKGELRLNLVEMQLSELHGATYNPRRDMTEHERETLNSSVDKYGLVQNIVVNMHEGREGTIISGHQRVETLRQLGAKTALVKQVDVDEVKEKRMNVAMNGINGGWDYVKLQELLDEKSVDEIGDLGFTRTESEAIFDKVFGYPTEPGQQKQQQAGGETPDEQWTCPHCGYVGTPDEFEMPVGDDAKEEPDDSEEAE